MLCVVLAQLQSASYVGRLQKHYAIISSQNILLHRCPMHAATRQSEMISGLPMNPHTVIIQIELVLLEALVAACTFAEFRLVSISLFPPVDFSVSSASTNLRAQESA